MTATIYTDFTLYKWKYDVEMWYKEHYYPKDYQGTTPVMDEHLNIMSNNYDYDLIEGSNICEKRINFLTFCQTQVEKSFTQRG